MMAAAIAGTLSLVAFLTYSQKTFQGQTHPNITSWCVWSFITILNFTSYKKVTGGWIKSLLPTANAIMTIVVLGIALWKGSFGHLGWINAICLVFGIVAGIVWIVEDSPATAQVLLQIAIVIGFIPTITAVYISPGSEPWQEWLLWIFSFIAQFVAVRSTWEKKTYIEFLYPVNMIICHAIVFLLTVR